MESIMKSDKITEEELAELEGLYNASTPGEWVHHYRNPQRLLYGVNPPDHEKAGIEARSILLSCQAGDTEIADAQLIVKSRNALPRLIAEVRRLKEYEWKYKDLND